jgi:hypothetical protein
MYNINSLSDRIIDNLYNEIKELLISTTTYFETEGRSIRQELSLEDKLNYTLNMGVITSMLTSSLTWVCAYKAYREDGLTMKELLEGYSLPDLPEPVYNNIKSLQPHLTKSIGVANLVKRHISNLKV